MGTMTAIALVLSVRLILLLSVIGAFILCQGAMSAQTPYTLIALAVYCVFTVPVITYLDICTRRKG